MAVVTNILIIGAGPGGLGFAYDLMLRGYSVLVYTHRKHQRSRKRIEDRGYVGVKNNGIPLDKMTVNFTSDPVEAANFSTIIAMSLRGDIHEDIWREFESVDLSRHLILYIPGFCAGWRLPAHMQFDAVFQAVSTPVSTLTDADGINIIGRKARMVACGPEDRRDLVRNLLGMEVKWAFNELDVATRNPSGVFHPSLMLGNADRIMRGEDFLIYREGLTPAVIDRVHHIFAPVKEMRRLLNFEHIEDHNTAKDVYVDGSNSLEEFRDKSRVHADVPAPKTLDMRWLHEDIAEHYVLWAEIADKLGVDATPIKADIRKAGKLTGRDFFEEGAKFRGTILEDMPREDFIEMFGKPTY